MRLFVLIPAYRDSEVYRTVEDCFNRACYPKDLRICVLWQRGEEEPLTFPYSHPNLKLVVKTVPASESKGLGWARSESAKLCLEAAASEEVQGEDFVMMLDSHHRFVPGWDGELRRQMRLLPPKSLITCYAQMYKPPETLLKAPNAILSAQGFDDFGILKLQYLEVPVSKEPLPGFVISLHFVYAPLRILAEVPFDPKKYFRMEEIVYSVRCWTHGWNIFNPFKAVLYHYYTRTSPKHWEDHSNWWSTEEVSWKHFQMILGMIPDSEEVRFGPYGLGRERTLQEYQTYSGINFEQKKVEDRTKKGKPV